MLISEYFVEDESGYPFYYLYTDDFGRLVGAKILVNVHSLSFEWDERLPIQGISDGMRVYGKGQASGELIKAYERLS